MNKSGLALAALALAGCASFRVGQAPRAGNIVGNWQVVEVNRQALPLLDEYRIRFVSGLMSARFGCNAMGGQYRQARAMLHAGSITSTLMGCPEPAATIERDAGLILAAPMTLSWSGRDQVQLANRAGRIVLRRIP